MLELDVVGSKGYCFPVWRYAGVREWQYCQVDGQIVSLPDARTACQFLDEVCARLAARRVVYRRLVREPVSRGR